MNIPSYLKRRSEEYQKNPRETNMEWFKEANLGLFLHFGLYSMLGRHEWVQLRECIYVNEYEKLADSFSPDAFDAKKIVGFAKEIGAKYINFTTRHHDSYCLFKTNETHFNSLETNPKRDFVKELYDACEEEEIALFLYYSHGRDWRHPHAPNNDEYGGSARPEYLPKEKTYAYGAEHNLSLYVNFMRNQIKELLLQYPNVAGIWLDGIAVPMNGDPKPFKLDELYEMIRKTSKHALVSYKQGMTGNEDFFAPEHYIPTASDDEKRTGDILKKQKKIEVCTTMIKEPVSWGYYKDAVHKTEDEVKEVYDTTIKGKANLLINIGIKPDGSLDEEDVKTLKNVFK